MTDELHSGGRQYQGARDREDRDQDRHGDRYHDSRDSRHEPDPKPVTCGPDGPGCEKMIYIGQLNEMDRNEASWSAENAVQTIGGQSFGGTDDPLYQHLVQVNLNDENGDGRIFHDNAANSETITHAASGSSADYRVDTSFVVHNAQLNLLNEDGSSTTICTAVRVMQDDQGNTFIMPPPQGASNAEIQAMTTRPIISVSFPSDPRCYDLCKDSIFTDRNCFPCFASGTLIETESGPLPVENLRPGTLVWTRDNGLKPLLWTGSRKLGALHLATQPNLRPIRIRAGALGTDTPTRDLLVSPQHRVLVRSRIAQRIFGAAEVLVAAKQLLQLEGIDIATDLQEVEYFHLLFDQHEVIMSDGAETESLYTGPESLKSVGPAARAEIIALFPELESADAVEGDFRAARLLASGRMARKLAVRHKQHRRALIS